MHVVLAQKPRSQGHLLVCPQRGEPAAASDEGSHIPGPPDSSHFSPQLQEKRIYDLKKKNQELEKFKFVLDYKIKELKKQIEPRENEIKVMKEQIQEVRSHCHTLPSPTSCLLPGYSNETSSQPLCAQGACSLHSAEDATEKAQPGVQLCKSKRLWHLACQCL